MKSKRIILIGVLVSILLVLSCDGETGMDGIIVDSQTWKAIEEVKVNTISDYENIEVLSDSLGHFYTKHAYTCGCNCDESFIIIFSKEGYEDLELNDDYFSKAELVEDDNNNFHGLLVYVKMKRIN